MAVAESPMPDGERIRKAVRWISDSCCEKPEEIRNKIIREAEVRFDLSPVECEFLSRHFCTGTGKK